MATCEQCLNCTGDNGYQECDYAEKDDWIFIKHFEKNNGTRCPWFMSINKKIKKENKKIEANEREKLNMKEYQAIHIVDLLLEDLGNRSGFDYILDEVRNDHKVFDEIKKAWKDIVLSGSQY